MTEEAEGQMREVEQEQRIVMNWRFVHNEDDFLNLRIMSRELQRFNGHALLVNKHCYLRMRVNKVTDSGERVSVDAFDAYSINWRVWRVFKLSLTFDLDCHARSCNSLYLLSQNTPALASWYTSSSIYSCYAPKRKPDSVQCWTLEPHVCTLSNVINTRDWPVAHERMTEIPFWNLELHSEIWH